MIDKLRSLLFAPAVRPDFIAKLAERGADAVVIDCEDATPANAKAEGRANARELAPQLAAAGCRVTVRINAQPTEWFADETTGDLHLLPETPVDRVAVSPNAFDDFDSVPRSALTDLGGDQVGGPEVIFTDGFESGDTTPWAP